MSLAVHAEIAHAMDGAAAARDWPPLTVDELSPVLAAYPGLGEVRRVTWQSPRPFAASGIVLCARGAVFAKRHHCAVRTPSGLAEEHYFIRHLRAAGAAVPDVLAARDGTTVQQTDAGVYEVHAVSDGIDLYRNDASWTPMTRLAHAHEAGRALGTLHAAAAGYDAPPRATRMLVADFHHFAQADPLESIARDAALQPALAGRSWRRDMQTTLMEWHAALLPHLAALTPLWTHNDLHASNLLWRRDGAVATIIDFGLANRTSAIFDVATCIERNAIAWLRLDATDDIGVPAIAQALLRGYRETQDFSPAQSTALRRMLPLVHVDFALSELMYFHGVTRSAANAALAYDTFLLGHAAWFATPHGRAFLNAIQ